MFFNDRHVVATRNNFIYVNFQPKAKLGNKHFSGLKYLPIDTRGKLQKQINFDNVGRYINCLIGFGAVDSKDITCLVLNAIASSDSLRSVIRPICLVGENYRGLAELKKVLGKFEHSVILSGLNSTLDVPIACFVGIGAPGVSHVERLFLGVPTILIPQKHVHINLCRKWEEIGCATWSLPHSDKIVAKIYEMIDHNFAVGRAVSKRGQRLVMERVSNG